jgi:Ca2+-binding EF-hand superfamily protein
MGCFKSKKIKIEELNSVYDSQWDIIKEENKLYKEIDQLFHEHDKDNDLNLDGDEFTSAITEFLKRNKHDSDVKERVESFIEQMIISKRKKFTKDEFRIIMSSVAFEDFTINEMIDLFKTFDKKKDGKICPQELVHTFKNLGLNINKDIASELIREASYSNQEQIDFEEFARAILSR